MGEPQSRFGRYGEVKIFYPTGTRTPAPLVFQPVASRYTDLAVPEGLGQFKNLMTSSGIEPVTFQLVAKCMNQLSYHVPPDLRRALFVCRGTGKLRVTVRLFGVPAEIRRQHLPNTSRKRHRLATVLCIPPCSLVSR
jgi:hypothetical protein